MGGRENSHFCLGRCEPSNSKEEPDHIPCPGAHGPNSPAPRALVQVPHLLSGLWPSTAGPGLMVCGERSISNNTGAAGACLPSPAHSSVPKNLWFWFPQRSPGAHGEVPKAVTPSWAWGRQDRNVARLKPAAWKNAHSGRMPSNKFIVFYYIFPFLHLIPIPHIQTLLSERK